MVPTPFKANNIRKNGIMNDRMEMEMKYEKIRERSFPVGYANKNENNSVHPPENNRAKKY
jgi:hypothetical protein